MQTFINRLSLRLLPYALCLLLTTHYSLFTNAQSLPALERVEPAFWWVGMKYNHVQLIVHGDRIAERAVAFNYPHVKMDNVHKVENPNYLFVDIFIEPGAIPGKFAINFSKKGEKPLVYEYELKNRNTSVRAQGVTNKDFVYLIMADRFSNGDPSNDVVRGMNETTLNRDSMYYRHGGDIQGVINHLDYLQELGITSLWLCPVIENDEPSASYHGYANTENYKIDRRYGTNELYKALVDSLHKRDMKMVMDVVPNHFGNKHWTVVDMPMKDWVHQWPTFTRSSFHDQPDFDPYAADIDKRIMQDGWFDYHMPDMNQNNPYVENYIAQSYIWWIEYAGVDGFRIDTYPYNDKDFMASWMKKVKTEYPHFSLFGEAWVHGVVNEAFFTQGNTINQGFDTQLPGVTDFQSLWAITEAMTKPFGWDDGVMKVYTTLAKDFVYQDATRNVVFLDNHDLSRFYSVVGENVDKLKSGVAWLLTTRGVPQMYYGTEILMKGFSSPDGLVREDFKGGWQDDKENKFVANGRTDKENDFYNFVRALANYRKKNAVLQTGKLMQYVPENGVYVYFRYNQSKTVMIVMNTNNKTETIATKRFTQRIGSSKTALNITSGGTLNDISALSVPANNTLVLELK